MPAEDAGSMLSWPGSRALLVGCGHHAPASHLPDVPAIEANLADLKAALVERSGMALEHVRDLGDPAGPQEFGDALIATAGEASDALLIYYSGHGVVGPDRQLYLATQRTLNLSEGIPAQQALPYSAVASVIEQTSTRLVIIVLDCCFAGRAYSAQARDINHAFDTTRRYGTYLIAAASYDERAWALPGERNTAFTGEIIRVLNDGDPPGPPWITLDSLYRAVDRALVARGLPRPRRQAADSSDAQLIAPNRAYQRPAPPELPDVSAGPPAESPYCGLEPYGAQNARYFFGRDAMIDAIVSRVAEWDNRLIVVTGPSGSGKSSLLRAGLIPALDSGRADLPSQPCVLLTLGPGSVSLLRDRLSAAAREATGRFVVIIDQFEELFTSQTPEAERRQFIAMLADTARAVPVVLGIRADFYGRCAAYPELVTALERPLVVGPMTTAELREAIEGPARVAGLALQDRLVELLLRDLGTAATAAGPGAAGVLPFLSYALLATWQHREGSTLTLAAYHATGGIDSAVAQAADAIIEPLSPEDRQIIRRLLLRLVRVGDATDDTRRTVPLAELLPPSHDPRYATTRAVLDAFIAARLLTAENNAVTITHEALIRAWPQLQAWINEDRAGLLQWQRVTDAAASWDREGRDPGGLYHGQRLATAAEWAADPAHRDDVGPLAREFLDASVAAEQASALQARRRRRLRRQVQLALALLVLLAVGAGGIAYQRNKAAAASALTVTAQRLTTESDALLNTDPRTSLILGAAAMATQPSSAARAGLLTALNQTHYAGRVTGAAGIVNSIAFAPGGTVLAVAAEPTHGKGGSVTLWDTATRQRLATFRPPGTLAASVSFSPSGTLAVGADGIASLWNVSDPRKPRQVGEIRAGASSGSAASFTLVSFSPAGGLLATADYSATAVNVWNAADASHPVQTASITGLNGPANALAWRPDGRQLAVGSNGSAPLYGVTAAGAVSREGAVPFPDNPEGGILALAYSPDGETLATAFGPETQLWSVTNPADPVKGTVFADQAGQIQTETFSSQGVLVSGGQDDVAYEYIPDLVDRGTYKTVALRGHTQTIISAAFSPDGDALATADVGGTVTLWRTYSLAQPEPVSGIAQDRGYNVGVYLPGGRLLVTGATDRTVQVWQTAGSSSPQLLSTTAVPVGGAAVTPEETVGYDGVNDIAYSPSTGLLATASFPQSPGTGGIVTLWRIDSRGRLTYLATISSANDAYTEVAFSGNGKYLFTGGTTVSGPSLVTRWDVTAPASPREAGSLNPGGSPDSLAVNSAGTVLAVSTQEPAVTIWDISAARPRRLGTLPDISIPPNTVVFSPDGRALAVGSQDGNVLLFDVSRPAAPALLSILSGSSGAIDTISFAPNGRSLLSSGDGRTASLWDIDDRTNPVQLASLAGQTQAVHAEFSPDGTDVVTASLDGTIWWWQLPTVLGTESGVVSDTCAALGTIARYEWASYVSPAVGASLCRTAADGT